MSKFDDPVDAALEQIEIALREDDQFLGVAGNFKNISKTLAKLIVQLAKSPTPSTLASAPAVLLEAWQEDSSKRTLENQNYLFDAVVEKLRLHDHAFLADDQRIERLEDAIDHTLAYVGPTSSRYRLDSFAAIAVSGAMVYTSDPLEQTDEFLRIAGFLQETDIMVLREAAAAQAERSKGYVGFTHILHEVQAGWPDLLRKLNSYGIQPLNYRSAFARLQGQGLMERTEPNSSLNGLGDTPYLVLELGEKFLQYLADYHNSTK